MNKYIDADKLIAEIEKWSDGKLTLSLLAEIKGIIASLQQDKDVLDLCSRVWWEDRGWMMIPPNITLKGLEGLLERVRHKIKWNKENGIKEQEQPEVDLEKEMKKYFKGWTETEEGIACNYQYVDLNTCRGIAHHFYELGLNARKDELPEIELNKFTNKVDTFKARYKHPEIVSIKGAMAFMARMFYQYPNVARQWYDSLPKATMD